MSDETTLKPWLVEWEEAVRWSATVWATSREDAIQVAKEIELDHEAAADDGEEVWCEGSEWKDETFVVHSVSARLAPREGA
jgi:hypothetical protein